MSSRTAITSFSLTSSPSFLNISIIFPSISDFITISSIAFAFDSIEANDVLALEILSTLEKNYGKKINKVSNLASITSIKKIISKLD